MKEQNTACDACKLRKTKCSLSTWSGPGQDLQDAICEGCQKRNVDCTKALSEFKIPQKVYSTLNRLDEGTVDDPSSSSLHGPEDRIHDQPPTVPPPSGQPQLPQLDLPWLDVDIWGLPQLVPSVPIAHDQTTAGSASNQKNFDSVVQAGINERGSNSSINGLTEEETWALSRLIAGHGQEQAVTGSQGDLIDQSWLTDDGTSAVNVAGPSGSLLNSWASVSDDRIRSGNTSGVVEVPFADGSEIGNIQSGPVDRRLGKRSFDQLDQSSSFDPTITTAASSHNTINTSTNAIANVDTNTNTNTDTNTNASTSAIPNSVGRSVWSNDWLDLTPPGRESKKPRTEASLSLVPVDLGFQDLGNLLARTSERKELSRSLVNTYLAVFHAQYPLLDPHILRRKFDAAGQDPERLAPVEQVTFACIEAWAARSSMHPAVLRMKRGGALFIGQASSPERVDYDAMSPLPSERAAVGRSRIPVCQALKDRALRLSDTHGIMRRPSLEGLKSLLLLSNLMMGEIPKGWEEGQDAEMDREVSIAHARG